MGAVPSLMLFFGSMMLSDTPNSLVQRGRAEDGRKTLQRIRGTDNVDVEVCVLARLSQGCDRIPALTALALKEL